MIEGRIVGLEARIAVMFRLSGRPDETVEFVLDTGFEGALALSSAEIARLGLPLYDQNRATLADDSSVPVNVHVGTVL